MRYAFRHRLLPRRAHFELLGSKRRELRLEPLEVREMLDATAWTNPDKALDVDGDNFIVGTDALIIVNRLNSGVDTKLPELGSGETPDFYYDTNGDGFCTASDVLAIANRLNASNSPPILTAALVNDTGPGGVANTDGVTSDPTIAGNVSDIGPLVFFTASVNDSAEPVSIQNIVQPNGSFQINSDLLGQLSGVNNLIDGTYNVQLTAVNELGYLTQKIIKVVYDRGIDTPPTPDLAAASDTGVSATDNITKINTPTISVAAEPGSTVTLYVDGVALAQTVVASPTAVFNLDTLADGAYQVTAKAVDGAGNESGTTASLNVTIRSSLAVEMITVPFMDDLTPYIPVVVSSASKITDGTPVYLDIDRNNDGDYDDPNETNAAQSTVYNGNANLTVTTPLPPSTTEAGYLTKTRVRVSDEAGNFAVDERTQSVNTNLSTALKDYVQKNDQEYKYTLNSSFTISQSGFSATAYVLDMTSQKWRTEADVDHTVWRHWVTIYVPNVSASQLSDTALLNIGGGSYTNAPPNAGDSESKLLATFALATRSIVVSLEDVPNEPLFFTGDPGNARSEDAIIAYSFDEFLKNPTDTEWPVLVAMVKSAVKAMDTVQDFVPTVKAGLAIDDFVVTGGSKRGWTTWLTPAADDRIKAIMPVVFDSLNLDQQMLHHYGVYGFFSPAIQDYNDEEIFNRILTENGSKLGQIVDPYHYLALPNYTIPKYSINSAGDEFFVSDSSQYYFNDLPGTQNYLRYVPNSGHGLDGTDAGDSAAAFYNAIIHNIPLPKFTSKLLDDGSLQVTTTGQVPGTVKLWQTTNPVARDFRDFYTGLTWTSTNLTSSGDGVYTANVPIPATGATAFFIELSYPTSGFVLPTGPVPFKFTTQISVQTNLPLYAWPFEVADPVAPAPGSLAAASFVGDGSLADALQATSFAASLGDASVAAPSEILLPIAAPLAAPATSATSADQENARAVALAEVSFGSSAATAASDRDESSSDLADSIFDDELFDPTSELEELLAIL